MIGELKKKVWTRFQEKNEVNWAKRREKYGKGNITTGKYSSSKWHGAPENSAA